MATNNNMFSSTRPSDNRNDASGNRYQSYSSNNRFQSDASGNRFQSDTSYSSNRNYNQGNRFQSDSRPNIFNMKPRQPEIPEPKPVPPISEFPSLLRQSPKAVLAPVLAPASAYSKIAQQAASIVVPVPEPPKKQKPVEQQINIININQLKKIRMTMPEYLERKEYGEELDDDMISICSEYSNNIDENDDDSDDDDNC